MQLVARFAATLLALTWIAPVAQAATALRDFRLVDGTGHDPVPGSTLIVDGGRIIWVGDDEFGDLPSRMPAEISKAISDQAHERELRALAHIFYLDNAKTLVSQGADGFAHSVRNQPVDLAAGTCPGYRYTSAMKRSGLTWDEGTKRHLVHHQK